MTLCRICPNILKMNYCNYLIKISQRPWCLSWNLFKEESFGGATECTPCSLGSAATRQLNSVVAAMDANEQQLFSLVDASMELQGSLGSLTFQASCATIPQVNFTVEVISVEKGVFTKLFEEGLIMFDPSSVLDRVCCTFFVFAILKVRSKLDTVGKPRAHLGSKPLPTFILFELQVWLASTQSIDLELQLGSRAPVGWSFNVVQGVWQTTDASPQITIPRGESLVRLWASTPGLRIRSLTMQFQNMPDECGFVPNGELWTCSRCAPGPNMICHLQTFRLDQFDVVSRKPVFPRRVL